MAAAGNSRGEGVAGRDSVGSLKRGLAVIEILAAHPSGLTLTEVAGEAGLTRAGARRLLLTLVEAGYALQEGRRFTLSPRLLATARLWLQGDTLWSFAEPFMRRVSAALDESCSAAILSGHDIVYVARVPGRRIMSVALDVGAKLPAWCTSMGRVLLAGLSEPDRDAFIASVVIEPRTVRSITDRTELAHRIAGVARDGFCIVDEELEIGLRSIAVPIRDRAGRVAAAINVSAQSSRFDPAEMEALILPQLREAARGIEGFFIMR